MIPIIGLLSTAGIIISIYALIKGSAPRLGIKSRKIVFLAATEESRRRARGPATSGLPCRFSRLRIIGW